ncbi:MAG: GGDEF domain-containing protein [Candidatus Dadabacteria bacterium]|nr:MAG: GGDEF domain-containing protein [Candidatus Dadabacteria bacterium]
MRTTFQSAAEPEQSAVDPVTALPTAMQLIDDILRARPTIVAFAAFEIDGFAALASEHSSRDLLDLMREIAMMMYRSLPGGMLLARGHNSPFLVATPDRGERSATRYALRAIREASAGFLPSGYALSLSAGVATATEFSLIGLRSAICVAECQAKRARATGGGALMLDSGTRCVPATFGSFDPLGQEPEADTAWAS